MASLTALIRKIMHAGVVESTPVALIDRVIFSNIVCLVGTAINSVLALINLQRGYYIFLGLTGVYQLAMILCVCLNYRRRYLLARVVSLAMIMLGMLAAGLIQGPQIEIEHFFLPFGVLAFTLFYAEERHYGVGFLLFAVGAYFFLVNQGGPTWDIDPRAGGYRPQDRVINQIGYLALFVTCLFALSKAFERALAIVHHQRERRYEEEKFLAFGMLVGNVAHEVNSPLAALDVQLFQLDAMMESGSLNPAQVRERIARIRKVSGRLSVIVRGLKFLSGQDSGDTMAHYSVSSLLECALDLTRDRIEKEKVRFDLSLQNCDQKIYCRPVALSQVFLNLLNNALDAVESLPEEKRWIKVEAEQRAGRWITSVTDGGMISSAAARENLFRSFFTTKNAGRGTGLGLSISRKTVLAHHGDLRFDENSPHTKFVLDIPLAREGA